ncbi:hypothetical protein R3P38DRAFT_3229682 [Favolaschia claudopus]|uniref:F-box domain-containing protein n=1 Tax=Favolaschia claudopus TaxID=2862362 RepID=A0AAV9ZPM9_9AGAR
MAPPPAPIQRVPYDVLLDLLRTVYQPSESDWVNTVDDRTSLSLVCKEWRQTILSSPQFWQHLPINRMTSVAFIERQLRHSLQLDLVVFVNMLVFTVTRKLDLPSDIPLESPTYVLETLLPFLLPHMHRVKSFSVTGYNELEMRSVMAVVSDSNVGRLQTLTGSVLSPSSKSISLPTFATVPHLLRLSTTAGGLWADTVIYKHLRTLRISNSEHGYSMKWKNFIEVLKAASSLRILQLFHLTWEYDMHPDEFPHLDMVSVTELHVTANFWGHADRLNRLHFPHLHTLRIATASPLDRTVQSTFAECLLRIRRLELVICRSANYPTISFDELIAAAVNISELRFPWPWARTWASFVESARARTLVIPNVRWITVDGAVAQEEIEAVLACAPAGCVVQAGSATAVCHRWVLRMGRAVAECICEFEPDSSLDGIWKTEMHSQGRTRRARGNTDVMGTWGS